MLIASDAMHPCALHERLLKGLSEGAARRFRQNTV
jgi:hypothetical protein